LGPPFNIGFYAFLCIYSLAYTFLSKGGLPALAVGPFFYQAIFLMLIFMVLLYVSYRADIFPDGEILVMERGRLFGFLLFNFVFVGLMLLAINGFDSSRKPALFQIGDLIFLVISICLTICSATLLPATTKIAKLSAEMLGGTWKRGYYLEYLFIHTFIPRLLAHNVYRSLLIYDIGFCLNA
jgi:hypothetical protein